jgi:hypothetical protein
LKNAIFDVLKALSQRDTAKFLQCIEPADSESQPWTRQRIVSLLDTYHLEHERIRLDPEARAAKHTHFFEDDTRRWTCEQILVDPEEGNDWSLRFTVDLDRCDAAGSVVLVLETFGPLL